MKDANRKAMFARKKGLKRLIESRTDMFHTIQDKLKIEKDPLAQSSLTDRLENKKIEINNLRNRLASVSKS